MPRKIKDNLFNRLFNRKALKEQREYKKRCQRVIGFYKEVCEKIKEANSLTKLVDVHKWMWDKGFQNYNLGPCEWGMFRTKSIPEMKPEEVYLGGICGLHTKPIPFWENRSHEEAYGVSGYEAIDVYPETPIYEITLGQYKDMLNSNAKAIYNSACKFLFTTSIQ